MPTYQVKLANMNYECIVTYISNKIASYLAKSFQKEKDIKDGHAGSSQVGEKVTG